MPISVASPGNATRVSNALMAALKAIARSTLTGEGRRPGEISIVLARDPDLRALNRRWRRIDRATDVLSFPYADERGRVDGDLVISLDRLAAQAKRFHVTLGEELARLVVHGTLHLCGLDHHRVAERAHMRRRESTAMRASAARFAALDRAIRAAIRLAVVAVLLGAASPARSAGPRASSAAGAATSPQRDTTFVAAVRLTRWRHQAGAADSATVTRYALSPRVATDSSAAVARGWTSKTLTRRRVGRDWIERFLAFVPGDRPYLADKRCAPSAPGAFTPQEIAVGVRFGDNDSSASASVLSQELCIQLSVDRAPAGSLTLERSRLEVLRLLAEALPDDEAVQQAAADTAHVATGGSDTPKLGEYVFVEELPEALRKVPPVYPDDARRRGVQGTVMTQALVGRDGKVREVRILKSIPGLDEAAAQAVRQWEFKPALAKGAPVAVWVAIPVKFSLH